MNRLKGWTVKAGAVLHSVRFRLALWFALVLAIILIFFSAFVYARTLQDIRSFTAARLVLRLKDMNERLRLLNSGPYDSGWWPPDAWESNPFTLQAEEVVILSDSKAVLAETWGSINAQETADITARVIHRAFTTDAEQAVESIFTYPLVREVEGESRAVDYLFIPAPILYDNRLTGWIIIGQPVDPESQLPRLFWTLFLAGSLTLIVAVFGSYWLADRSLWPVKAITRTAQEISETDLNRRLNIHTRDELGELAGTFDRMLDRLQLAFDRQRRFTADASHELRTPLTIIGLETGRALDGKRTAEEYRNALEVIQSENEFMTSLVNELLTLARMDAGQVKLNREPLDLSELALEVVERFEKLAAHKNIRLQVGDLPELPILGDRQHLAQMIGNLLDNAIKYSPEKRPGQWVRLETGEGPPGQPAMVWIRIIDNGPGIASEHLPHLFERFYRVDPARSHNPDDNQPEHAVPGSGLGLSIVQWIAQMHGGQVTVDSAPGQGTTFEVRLPRQPFPGSDLSD